MGFEIMKQQFEGFGDPKESVGAAAEEHLWQQMRDEGNLDRWPLTPEADSKFDPIVKLEELGLIKQMEKNVAYQVPVSIGPHEGEIDTSIDL